MTIEVKPVDRKKGRYTFKQLLSALENQLVGQYMSARNSRHGILLIAMLERRKWDPRDGAGKIDFHKLIKRLNEEASSVCAKRSSRR